MADHEITLADLSAVLDETAMSKADKDYVLRSFWTQQEVPAITSQAQYGAYAKWQAEIEAGLKANGILPTDPAYARSQEGVLATSIGAKMIEWEER